MTLEQQQRVRAIDLALAQLDIELNPARVIEDMIQGITHDPESDVAKRRTHIIENKATLRSERKAITG